MKTSEIALLAQKAGELLLISGAEIYRVEETINRICKAYGAYSDAFALPTGIFITVKDDSGDTVTLTLRIKERANDFTKIAEVNNFSRETAHNPLSFDEAMEALKKIENSRHYPYPLRMVTSGATAMVFSLMFGGGLIEGTTALITGILIFLTVNSIRKIFTNQILEYFLSGMLSGVIVLIAGLIFKRLDVYSIIIGSIMMQLPGVAITNGIRDGINGDIVSAIARIIEAILWVTALGVGVAVVLMLR